MKPESLGRSAASPALAFSIITSIYAINMLDRQIINVLAEPIKQDLGLNDTQMGMLSGLTFAIFYAALSLPIAMLADRQSRVRLISICCVVWSIFTALCAAATSFMHLALGRIGVAVGEAGGTPPSYSLIADLYGPAKRATALAIFTLGAPIGTAAGVLLGGTIGDAYGWRWAFVIASAPGFILAACLILFVREPKRGSLDASASAGPPPSLAEFLRKFIRTPLLLRTTIAASIGSFIFFGCAAWLPAFLMRERGMSLGEVGVYYSFGMGLAMGTGQVLGGVLADRFAQRWPRAIAIVPTVGFIVATPFFVIGLMEQTWQLALPIFLIAICGASLYGGAAGALIVQASHAAERSLATAVYLFFVNALGLGLAPLFIGIVSDATQSRHEFGGLMSGLLALVPFLFAAAALFWWVSRAINQGTKSQPAVRG